MKALDSMRVEYKHDSPHVVKSDKDYWLRWDFIIEHNGKLGFIEYDGEQHFKPVRFGGISKEEAALALAKRQDNDRIKNEYCKDNGYPLLRISYKQFGDINKLVADWMIGVMGWSE